MKKKEADFGIKLRHFFATGKHMTCLMELKQSKTNSIPFDCFEPGQVEYLQAAKSDKGVFIRNSGGYGVPDYSYFRNEPAYVVIQFKDGSVAIDIDTFLMEQKRSIRKSLTFNRSLDIATFVIK